MRWQSVEVCRSAACFRRTSGPWSHARGRQPADAQAGRQDLGRRAQGDGERREAPDGWEGRSTEPQRAVGVVLHDHEPVAVGQRGEVATAIEGQRAPRGVLEVGHDVAEAGPQAGGQVRLEQIRAQAVPVGLDRDEVRVGAGQRLQGSDVRRSLDHDVVAGIDQGPGQQVERLLRAGGDQDVLGVALATASGVRVGHPLAQRGDPLGRAVLDGLGPVAAGAGQHRVGGLPQPPDREAVGRRQAAREREDVRPVGEVQQVADDRRRGASTAPGEQVRWVVGLVGPAVLLAPAVVRARRPCGSPRAGVIGDGQAHGDSVAATPGAGKRDPGATDRSGRCPPCQLPIPAPARRRPLVSRTKPLVA